MKEFMMSEETSIDIEEEILYFIEKYAPLEKNILSQVNKELEILNSQIKSYLWNEEKKFKQQEINEMEQKIAYL